MGILRRLWNALWEEDPPPKEKEEDQDEDLSENNAPYCPSCQFPHTGDCQWTGPD